VQGLSGTTPTDEFLGNRRDMHMSSGDFAFGADQTPKPALSKLPIMPERWTKHVMETAMKRLLPIAAMLFLGGAPGMSQVGPTGSTASPGMGMTSPLGGAGSVGPAGIPLGASELYPGGLSPGPLGSMGGTALCGTSGISVTGSTSAGGSSSTFDGGGLAGASGSCSSSGTVSGTQNSSLSSATTAGSTLGIGTIPLGATELGGTGISPIEPAPTLNFPSSSSCVGSSATATAGTFGSGTTTTSIPGISSSLGC
jgi:hypothetical protein